MNMWSSLQLRWEASLPRHRQLLLALAALGLCALVWSLGIAPALATLRTAKLQRPQLEMQLAHMVQLQAQARLLQNQDRVAPAEVHKALAASLQPLGAGAELALTPERATVTIKGVKTQALSQWLAQVRQTTKAAPIEAHWVRNPAGTWDGAVVLSVP